VLSRGGPRLAATQSRRWSRGLVADQGQDFSQLFALADGEPGEEGVLSVELSLGRLPQSAAAGVGERDQVPAAVRGVALADDRAFGFQRVEPAGAASVAGAQFAFGLLVHPVLGVMVTGLLG
jgi:hypothetical protein